MEGPVSALHTGLTTKKHVAYAYRGTLVQRVCFVGVKSGAVRLLIGLSLPLHLANLEAKKVYEVRFSPRAYEYYDNNREAPLSGTV